jgi:hypothetical protein
MGRIFSVCATLAALSLVASQQVSAGDASSVKGTFAFTLAETCVQQACPPQCSKQPVQPGFGADFTIKDANGAMTYGGASDGLMVFDGRGGVSIHNAFATNIFNASSFLSPGMIPLGFGFGPALPFSCVGNYSVSGGQITANLTCTATIDPKNPGNKPPNVITGFTSKFNMKGVLPQNPFHLLLTDLGDNLQPVTIFVNGGQGHSLNGNMGSNIMATRVCTRSTTLDRVSP